MHRENVHIKSLTKLGVAGIVRTFPVRIAATWLLVVKENILLACLPMLIGLAIDDLLTGGIDKLVVMGGIFVILIVVGVGRRIYDTRVYGHIRRHLGMAVDGRHLDQGVSTRTARLDMSRELVDFLEEDLPEIITAAIQLGAALIFLSSFHLYLSLAALVSAIVIAGVYLLFHKRFFQLNASLNEQVERQVAILEKARRKKLWQHLTALKNWEVKLSDTEAVVYGLIFLFLGGFILFNLWFGARLPGVTAGQIFSIVTYSWEYVEAVIMLPITMQIWTRLQEISGRINNNGA